jgi:phosphate transport system substrate-binding protein
VTVRKRSLLGAAGVLSLAACVRRGGPSRPARAPDRAAIAASYPTVDGSTSTHPLQVLAACAIMGVSYQWQEPGAPLLLPSTERRIIPDLRAAAALGDRSPLMIQHTGTHSAYVSLVRRQADLILVARAPSTDERQLAGTARVVLDAQPVALDALVVLVNAANGIESLSVEQVRDVYTGKATDWAQLGGPAGRIKAYQRDRNSGSQELLDALVMKGARMIEAPDMMLETMMGPINAIGQEPLAIGYSVFYYATFMLPDPKVKLAGIKGVAPTKETIRSRRYPLPAEVYVVTRVDAPRDGGAAMLRDWLLSAEGQAAVAESGYVPAP